MMTDLEMTKLCAEAMGMIVRDHGSWIEAPADSPGQGSYQYHPLHDDAQAMALVKKLKLVICFVDWQLERETSCWTVDGVGKYQHGEGHDLNRAIVECVAKMQARR